MRADDRGLRDRSEGISRLTAVPVPRTEQEQPRALPGALVAGASPSLTTTHETIEEEEKEGNYIAEENFSPRQQVLVAEEGLTQQLHPVVARRRRTAFEPLEILTPETLLLLGEERPTSSVKEENRGDIGPTLPFLSARQPPPRLSRLLSRYCVLGFLFVASLLIVSTTEDPWHCSVSHPERPKQVAKEGVPRSTLPPAIPYYTFGREEDLRKLREYFTKPSRSAALTGLAGVGKSHCANKFAHDWVEEGRTLKKRRFGFWIPAETESSVRRGYNDILEAIGEEIKDLNAYITTARLAEILWSALTMPALDFEWIVVFDNVLAADSESQKRGPEVIKDWFFPTPKYSWGMGRILFTTQSRSYQGNTPLGYIKRFELKPLSTKASKDMLLAQMGKGWAEASRKTKKATELLVGKDYFDGLPIAIEAAAEYMNQQEVTLTEYLQQMNDVDPQSRVNKATQSVFDFARDQGCTRILDTMAFVSPDSIPLWLLGEDQKTVDAVRDLTALSIIKWDDHDHVSMHRLYQIALQVDGHIESAIVAVHHVLSGFDGRNHQTWSRPKELIPHVKSLKDRFGGSQVDKNVTLEFSDSVLG